MCKFHFSLDDVKGIFKALIEDNPDSIFETRTLGFLEKMHELYDIEIDLYCTYQHYWYCMKNVSDRYKKQFLDNGWINFGFHCFDEERSICDYSENFEDEYGRFENDIYRITGQNDSGKVLRLHGFEGSKGICMFLKNKGMQYLLGADTNRNSYFLDKSANLRLQNELMYHDDNTGIDFIRSCTRLEDVKDASFSEFDKEIRRYYDKRADLIPIYTHEWQLDKSEIRNLFENCCSISMEM